MRNEFIYNNMMNEFRKEISKCEALDRELSKIDFVTKKDGKPFKKIEQNIKGLSIRKYSVYGSHPYQKEIYYSVFAPGCGYVYDCIPLFATNEETKKKKPQNVNSDGIYILDVEDVKQTIKQKQEHYKNKIEINKNNIKRFKEICEQCESLIKGLNLDNWDLLNATREYIKLIL